MIRRTALALVLLASPARAQDAPAAKAPGGTARYELSAIRYAVLPGFRVSGLVRGADTSRRVDAAMSLWLARGLGRNVLIDAGFHRQRFVERWKPREFVSPAEAVRRAGIDPAAISDVVITHVHWDHADGIDLFPNALVWIQAEEYAHYVAPQSGAPNAPGIEPEVAALLHELESRGRLRLIAGDAQEFIPGITAYTGGKHTYASQFIGVRIAGGHAIVASDNLYLYENLERRVAIAQTLDAESNLRAQDRMRLLASELRLIIPGHDPAVYDRFKTAGDGVAVIR